MHIIIRQLKQTAIDKRQELNLSQMLLVNILLYDSCSCGFAMTLTHSTLPVVSSFRFQLNAKTRKSTLTTTRTIVELKLFIGYEL